METIDRVESEQTRARYPDSEGYVERDGVRVHYELFGSGEPTVLLLPTWSIIHSRVWKLQVPYLARHCRVITFDGRGSGLSDRPSDPEAHAEEEYAGDALAVLDATDTERAFIVGFSMGAQRALLLGEGRVLELGAPRDVVRADSLKRLYGVDVQVVPVSGGRHACLPSLRT